MNVDLPPMKDGEVWTGGGSMRCWLRSTVPILDCSGGAAVVSPTMKHTKYLRMLHQLDYRTSGLMLYSLNSKRLAGHICGMFERREVSKVYQAVLSGMGSGGYVRLKGEVECGRSFDCGGVMEAYERECRARGKAKKRKNAGNGGEEGGAGGHVLPVPEVPQWCRREFVGIFKHSGLEGEG
ncbi:hypothetical protein TrRE_jg344, partial [Triparma retinervis]